MLSETAILHLQNGFILPSFPPFSTPDVFQNAFHQDFPRVLSGYIASVNIMFAIDPFTRDTGATLVVPGSHQRIEKPDHTYLARNAVPVQCAAGSLFVFDSTLWHAAGQKHLRQRPLGHKSSVYALVFKQQIDYVRALGDAVVLEQPARTQQLLGWYSRVVTNLDEYYQPPDKRLYRKGQG